MEDLINKSKLDFYRNWLKKQDSWFRNKLWQIVFELRTEQIITGKNIIGIPLGRFKKKNIDLEDARKLLINLDNREIIQVGKIVGSNADKTGFLEQPLEDKESLFYDPETKIDFTHEFKYLYATLEKLQHPEKKKVLSAIDKKADKVINQFSLENLSFVLGILKDIANAIEFAPENKPVNYQLPPSMTPELLMARQLIDKFDSLGLFRNGGENVISGIVSIEQPNIALILKCMERGKRRLSMDELEKRRKRAEVQRMVEIRGTEEPHIKNAMAQGSMVDAAERLISKEESKPVLEITQKMDGSVFVICEGIEYKISRPELDLPPDRLIQKLIKLTKDTNNITFNNKDSTEISGKLSHLVTQLGFNGLLRTLFFPRTSKKSVSFIRYYTRKELNENNVDLGNVEKELSNITASSSR